METKIKLPDDIAHVCRVRREELENLLKMAIAIEFYREGLVSLGKASEIAGLERIDMMDLLRQKKVPVQYGVEELKEDVNTLEMIK
jgi:predicted HTH domain antitoxin